MPWGRTSVLLALAACLCCTGARANTVFLGGAIYTLNEKQPRASALVVEGGRIVYVGDDLGARAHLTKTSRLVRLHGRMMLPGFHDAHAHPMSAALRLLRCQLDGIGTARKVEAAIRKCDAGAKEDWLFANGWSAKVSPASLATLDALVPDRPAYIATADGFAVWVNSKTLKAAGIDPAAGIPGLERDPRTHALTGVVTGDALSQVRAARPDPSELQFREAFKRWSIMANACGITSVFDAAASPRMVDAYRAADLANEMTLRVVAAQLIDPKRGPEQIEEMILRRDRTRGPRFRADAAKIFLDGEISQHTAAMLEPYADEPDSKGELLVQPDALNALVRRLDAEKFMIHIHVMGDAAVRAGLDAIEGAMRLNGPADRRHQLAHVALADPEDTVRFGALQVAANFSPGWFRADDPDMAPTKAALGPKRANWLYPAGRIAQAGASLVLSSDWPATSMNPLEGIEVAVTRAPPGKRGPVNAPQWRIDRLLAVRGYTSTAAWAAREDSVDGSLEVGKAADLIVLDRNIFRTPARNIHNAHVLLTLLDGEPVYRNPLFPFH